MENQEKDSLDLFDNAEAKPRETEAAPSPAEVVDVQAEPAAVDEELREVPKDLDSGFVAPGLHPRISDIAEAGSFGHYLRELRLRNNFTIEQIADETKIRSTYLEALEAEDYSSLPQPVYVLGYVRKLCNLYRVDRERADEITATLREQLEYEIPEDITKTVIDHEVSEENERKIRQLAMILAAGGVLVVIVIVLGAVLLLAGLRSTAERSGSPVFDETQLIELQGRPQLETSELK